MRLAAIEALPLQPALAWVLCAIVLAGSARMLWHWLRAPVRPRAWRIAALLVLQCAGAFLLWRVLFPPPVHAPAGLLVVATADADRASSDAVPAGARIVALPEAPPLAGAARAPDLATALRRHPGTTRLQVLGGGLEPRDLDATRGLAVEFLPAPLPPGLVALWPPRVVQAGRRFEVVGRAHALPQARVELLDPAGEVVARAPPGADGEFRLAGVARAPGPSAWTLRLRDRDGARVEDAPLPLDVQPATRLRVLVLAGAPNPELKYLRRWASDAGLALDTRIALGAGMRMADAGARLDAGALAAHDLVLVDARSWEALGPGRASLFAAVRGGLGLLLQLPYATSPAERSALHRLGFVATAGRATDVRPRGDGTRAAARPDEDQPTLTRGPLRIAGADAVPLLPAADGQPLAWWRAHGLGRIGIAGFDDSYRLVLAGQGERHGDLWATLFSTLARPRASPRAALAGEARVGARAVLCGLPAPATVDAPDGRRFRLLRDPASGARACAALWPRVPGWHLLHADGGTQAFFVYERGALPGVRAARLRAGTLAATGTAPVSAPGPAVPGPRWPWFLGWLALATVGWWLERSRLGRAVPAGAARTTPRRFMRKSPPSAP
ncbi:MAG TPA: carboxypeptidase regulatory-like domain-containing protein [Xanthomonadaceae bacterium]|nr:carboxypeptidase regulatory-like domain-containing protein [Xanthomonadaceae bacterium]